MRAESGAVGINGVSGAHGGQRFVFVRGCALKRRGRRGHNFGERLTA